MNYTLVAILGTIVGGSLGWFIAYLVMRARHAAASTQLTAAQSQLTETERQLQQTQSELRQAVDAKARAEQAATRVPELEQEVSGLREKNTSLSTEVAQLKRGQQADQEKIEWVNKAEEQLREAFQALAGQALQNNAGEFLRSARQQLETVLTAVRGDWSTHKTEMQKLVQPLEQTLQTLDGQIRTLEQKREGAYKELGEQLRQLGQAQHQLQTSTIKLEQALKSPTVRGSWGQVQLRRVVELAGMESRVAFDEQATVEAGRPDLIVHLPNHTVLPVDAKAPMTAFLEAMEAQDEERRKERLQAHADAVRGRVKELSQKKYWEQFERAPEFVVMFVPNDTCLSAAFERDPSLLEYAFQQRVLLTTPVTLLALLKAVAYGWQQQQIAENARQIAEQGKELYDRLVKFVDHLRRTGGGLDSAVKAYNEAVGSLENRVLPAARRFKELGAITTELPEPEAIERNTREPATIESANRVETPSP